MGSTFPQWKGFELAPQGVLLAQVVDLRGDMGIAYERVIDCYKDFHSHDRLSFVFPRGGCLRNARRPRWSSPRFVILRSPSGGSN